MPDYKLVFQFTTSGNTPRAWGEVFYRSATDLNTAATLPTGYLINRLGMLNYRNSLKKMTVYDLANARASVIVPINQFGTSGTSAATQGATDRPQEYNTAAVVNLVSTVVGSSRKWWLRGMSDNDCYESNTNGSDVFSGYLRTKLTALLRVMNTNGFEIYPIAKTTAEPWFYVSQVGPTTAAGVAYVNLNDMPTWRTGDLVTFGSCPKKDLPALSGRFTVLAIRTGPPPSILIAYQTPLNGTINTTKGRVRKVKFLTGALIDNTKSGFAYISSRKSKSPFTGGRGARSAARGLRLQV